MDTSAGGGALLRFGYALPRSFDVQSGDRRLLLPGTSRDEPTSFYVFTGADEYSLVIATTVDESMPPDK